MSFKDFLHENFYDPGTKEPVKETVKPVGRATASVPAENPVSFRDTEAPTSFSPAPVADAYRQHFTDLIKQNNIQGLDYYEFVATKNKMSAITDEGQRYQAAFEGLSAAGLTKDTILKTAGVYIALIDKELSDFNKTFDQTFKQQVTDNQAAIDAKQNQIKQLYEDIKNMNDQISKGNSLTAKRDGFTSAGQEAKDIINSDIQKVNNYIQ